MNTNLSTLKLFNDPRPEYLMLLEPLFEQYICDPGTFILRQGQSADYLYLIVSGRAEVVYQPYQTKSMTITELEPGESCGWSAAIGSDEYAFSVVALEPLETVRVRSCDLKEFCLQHPEAGKDLLERLASSVSSRWQTAYAQINAILT